MIWIARSEGVSFWEIPDNELAHLTDQIIITIAAISGIQLPETELLATRISKEMLKLIAEKYSDYTAEEILTAIRFNNEYVLKNPAGEDIVRVDPPSRICVSFLSRLLYNYNILRTLTDRMIENKVSGY